MKVRCKQEVTVRSVNTSYGSDISFTTLPAPVADSPLNTANASPGSAAFVKWTLTFASPVNGPSASNFTLSGAAATGSGVTSQTNSLQAAMATLISASPMSVASPTTDGCALT